MLLYSRATLWLLALTAMMAWAKAGWVSAQEDNSTSPAAVDAEVAVTDFEEAEAETADINNDDEEDNETATGNLDQQEIAKIAGTGTVAFDSCMCVDPRANAAPVAWSAPLATTAGAAGPSAVGLRVCMCPSQLQRLGRRQAGPLRHSAVGRQPASARLRLPGGQTASGAQPGLRCVRAPPPPRQLARPHRPRMRPALAPRVVAGKAIITDNLMAGTLQVTNLGAKAAIVQNNAPDS